MQNLYLKRQRPTAGGIWALKARLPEEKKGHKQDVRVKAPAITSSLHLERSWTRPIATVFNEEQIFQITEIVKTSIETFFEDHPPGNIPGIQRQALQQQNDSCEFLHWPSMQNLPGDGTKMNNCWTNPSQCLLLVIYHQPYNRCSNVVLPRWRIICALNPCWHCKFHSFRFRHITETWGTTMNIQSFKLNCVEYNSDFCTPPKHLVLDPLKLTLRADY